jgi:tRNA (guanosine-2'-O-)-methyltransferase
MTPERQSKIQSVLEKRQFNLAIVMENVHDLHNISAVMRTCDAVGVQDLYIINTTIPKHYFFGPKSSSSAAKWLTVRQFDSIQTCMIELRKQYQKIYTTHLSTDAIELYDIDFAKESIALVFGNEHDGVSDVLRDLCDGNFIIPQVGMIKSLNISVACAISIYEAYRQKSNAGHYLQSTISEERAAILTEAWAKKKVKIRFKDLKAAKKSKL